LAPGRPAVRGFLFPDILPSERQLQFALVRQLFAKRPGKPIKEGTVLLHEADNHVRACPMYAAGWRSGVAVNLLADFEGVSGAVRVITDVHNMGSSIGSNPGSKPDCVTRLIAELDQPHIRSPLIAAAPISRLRQAGLRTTRPFYDTAFRQGIARFVDLDPPGLIRPW